MTNRFFFGRRLPVSIYQEMSWLKSCLLYVGLNITKVTGKWEECGNGQDDTDEWQATASFVAKMLPSE